MGKPETGGARTPLASEEREFEECMLVLAPTTADQERESARAAALRQLEARYRHEVWATAFDTASHYLREWRVNARDIDGACRINLDDFVESVFLWLANEGAEEFRKYRSDPTKAGRRLSGWLRRCTRNRMIDYLRRLPEVVPARVTESADGERQEWEPEDSNPTQDDLVMVPTDAIERLERRIDELRRASVFRSALRECLVQLSQNNRKYFLATFLAYGCLLDRQEIVDALRGVLDGARVTANQSSIWQSRGLAKLRECLAGKGFEFIPRQSHDWRRGFSGGVLASFPEEDLVQVWDEEVS